jgi:cyclophilin family peptidyl-prolyl cis-trans isomerase
MPHSSRKRRVVKPKSAVRASYILGAVIVVVIAGAAWYVYSSSQSGSSAGLTTTNTSAATNATANLIYAKVDTSLGSFEVELFPSDAPKTVTNFVSLVNSGFYSNLVWHRIVKGFVIQTGDPNTKNGGGDRSLWGTGGSSQTVPLEVKPQLHNYIGYLGMARSQDPNSGSSQFYVNLANNTSLDGAYTVFGKVINGMDVVFNIGNTPVNAQSQPVNLVFLTKITILSAP